MTNNIKTVLLLLFISLSIASVLSASCSYEDFQNFKKTHNKNYDDITEDNQRFNHFCQTIERNERLNAQYPTATFGITQFADLSIEEFKSNYLMANLSRPDYSLAPEIEVPSALSNPTSFDWRNANPPVVSPVYNQGQCGSCWAFSATENIESVWALNGNTLVNLSMQQIVDCDTQADGCNGGWPYTVYPYVESVGGQDSLQSYPYTGADGTCAFSKSNIAAKVSGWGFVTKSLSESAMTTYVATTSPMSVCVDASTWSSYTGGIFPAKGCGYSIDHCVVITGYNLNGGYWWVRNSWGTSWGINGYMQLEYGVNACAVAQVVTSATVV